MAKQIQIRRGTSAEHETFTGAIGEITMDTDLNTIRVHDGETVGGHILARANDATSDYVVETYRATDGTSWYRKYKSGWIEQGGTINHANVVFPLAFSDTNYIATAISEMIDSGIGTISICYSNKSVSSIDIQVRWNGGARDTTQRMWSACGF